MQTSTLKRVRRLDSISLDQTYFTEEGYLVDHPIVTSVGIFEYTQKDGSVRRELRLPEEVFAAESLATYKGKPIIITHDAGRVDKTNVDEEQIGTILSQGYQDGDDVRAEIIIHNTDAMKQSGLRELSLGYDLYLDETPGVYEGQPYDAIQRDIIINHLALVGSARAGEQARLNIDSRDPETLKGAKTMAETKRNDGGMLSPDEMTAAIDAFKQRRAERMNSCTEPAADADPAVEEAVQQEVAEEVADKVVPDEAAPDGVQMVKDRRDRRDAEGDPADLNGAMGVIAQQDEDIDTLLGIIDCLKAGGVGAADAAPAAENTDEGEAETDEDCDNPKVNADRKDSAEDFRELLRVVRIGDRLNMDGLEAMSVKNAKKAVLKKLKPALRLDGKSAAYVNAAFDMAVGDMKTRKDTNYQRSQMTRTDSKATPRSVGSAADARQKMIDRRMKKEEK